MASEQDRFGVTDEIMSAARKAHARAFTLRVGTCIPTRREVLTMSEAELQPILIDWLHESPSELIPTVGRIQQVKAILETRSDSASLRRLIDECRAYIED